MVKKVVLGARRTGRVGYVGETCTRIGNPNENVPEVHVPRKDRTKIVQDRTTGKRWMITYCERCHYNYDLEPSVGEVSPKEIAEIMELPGLPLWKDGKFTQ